MQRLHGNGDAAVTKPCGGGKAKPHTSARDLMTIVFERAGPEVAGRHRLELCCRASDCGKLCRWMVKGPGLDLVRCTHPDLPEPVSLYGALGDREFICPDGRF